MSFFLLNLAYAGKFVLAVVVAVVVVVVVIIIIIIAGNRSFVCSHIRTIFVD